MPANMGLYFVRLTESTSWICHVTKLPNINSAKPCSCWCWIALNMCQYTHNTLKQSILSYNWLKR